MPLAYDVHPEFGYFCPAPRARRELRVAVVSILFGMVLGAAIVTIGAGHAADTASRNASGSDTVLPGGAGPSSQLKTAGNAKANLVEAIEPYPMRMVRVRSSKPASPLAGIPLGRSVPPEPPGSAGPASPENAEGPASPPASTPVQSSTAEPAVSETKKRRSAMRARRHQEDEDDNARGQNRRWPYWGERAYAEDRYWRGADRNWVY